MGLEMKVCFAQVSESIDVSSDTAGARKNSEIGYLYVCECVCEYAHARKKSKNDYYYYYYLCM